MQEPRRAPPIFASWFPGLAATAPARRGPRRGIPPKLRRRAISWGWGKPGLAAYQELRRTIRGTPPNPQATTTLTRLGSYPDNCLGFTQFSFHFDNLFI